MCVSPRGVQSAADRLTEACAPLANQSPFGRILPSEKSRRTCLYSRTKGAYRQGNSLARDPAPCRLPGVMKNRQVDMTKIKSLFHKRHYILDTNDKPLLYDDFIETCSYLYAPSSKSSIGNIVWAGTTCRWAFLLHQDTFLATSTNLFCNLEIEHAIFTSVKH